MGDWHLTVKIEADSYEGLQEAISMWRDQIVKVKSFKDFWTVNMGHKGGHEWRYSTECKSPVEARIAALREEADRLELEFNIPLTP